MKASAYSAAMKEFSQGGSVVWDYDHLNHFLTSPKGFVKGTAMGFAGLKKPDERANLIAYLRTLADTPAPLPEALPPRPPPMRRLRRRLPKPAAGRTGRGRARCAGRSPHRAEPAPAAPSAEPRPPGPVTKL